MTTALFLIAVLGYPSGDAESPPKVAAWLPAARATAARIDRRLTEYWRAAEITPARECDEPEFVRRAWLDLAGRVPTAAEWERTERSFATAPNAISLDATSRRERWCVALLESPEFALHFGRVLDSWLQGSAAGDEPFLGWLRDSLAQRRSWEALFEQLITPGTSDDDKRAARYLSKRLKNIDQLTSDSARAFFGVDITCARCHDHPLVDDWKQDHYYGLAAFLQRATEQGKNSGRIVDKPDGEVTFVRRNGQQQTAPPMFLTGQRYASEPKQNRRELLVRAALDEQRFFSRAAVNRVWAWCFGRGLVHPVDQMHSGNPASIPEVLDILAADFATHGYDLRQLVGAIALCRAYRASSRIAGNEPPAGAFAAYPLKPLTPWQWSLSWIVVTDPPRVVPTDEHAARRAAYLAAEKLAAEFVGRIDPVGDGFQRALYQATTVEALYLAHHASIQQRLVPRDENLAAQIVQLPQLDDRARLAWRTILGRDPTSTERQELVAWWNAEQASDAERVGALLWSLVTSAEFRFNH